MFLFFFLNHICQTFCDKKYLATAFVDVKGVFNSNHSSTLISQISALFKPHSFCNYISSLFRFLTFSLPSGTVIFRETYKSLPLGKCLSPILFNVYTSSISQILTSYGFYSYMYADDIVIFSHDKSIGTAICTNNFWFFLILYFNHILLQYLEKLFYVIRPK